MRALPAAVDPATRRARRGLDARPRPPSSTSRRCTSWAGTWSRSSTPSAAPPSNATKRRHAARQELTLTHGADGSRRFRGQLGPEGGALLDAALAAVSGPRPAQDGTPDPRTPGQRRAEGLLELITLATQTDGMPEHGGEPVTLTVITTRDYLAQTTTDVATATPTASRPTQRPRRRTLEDGTPLSPESTRRLGCDAWLVAAIVDTDLDVLDIGRLSRVIPRPMRRALIVRDQGCAFPGCGRPPRWCHGHHIRHWAHGGPTALTNLVLLCGRHHRVIHHHGWDVDLGPDGHPRFHPPPWIDPTRTPRPPWRPPHLTLVTNTADARPLPPLGDGELDRDGVAVVDPLGARAPRPSAARRTARSWGTATSPTRSRRSAPGPGSSPSRRSRPRTPPCRCAALARPAP